MVFIWENRLIFLYLDIPPAIHYSMKKVKDLLQIKKSSIQKIDTSASVYDALQMLAQQNIGSLLVFDGAELRGIFTERDYARKVILQGKASKETSVSEIMNDSPSFVAPDDSVEYCMALMSDKMVRYLVVKNSDGGITGILSIGDLVRFTIEEQRQTIEALKEYIDRS